MRWQELFADLEAEVDGWALAERISEVADRTRAEVSRVTVAARLHHAVDRDLRLTVAGVGELAGRLVRVGADWLLLAGADETVVLAAAVSTFWNLPAAATAPSGISPLVGRLSATAILRAIARDRSAVVVTGRDGRTTIGTPDRVGADWVELAVHEWGEHARHTQIRSRATLPLAQVATVRRRPSGWD